MMIKGLGAAIIETHSNRGSGNMRVLSNSPWTTARGYGQTEMFMVDLTGSIDSPPLSSIFYRSRITTLLMAMIVVGQDRTGSIL